MKEEPVWGNEVVNEKLTTALDTCFSRENGGSSWVHCLITTKQRNLTDVRRLAETARDKHCPARTAAHNQ